MVKDFDAIEFNALALNISLGALKLQQPRVVRIRYEAALKQRTPI